MVVSFGGWRLYKSIADVKFETGLVQYYKKLWVISMVELRREWKYGVN